MNLAYNVGISSCFRNGLSPYLPTYLCIVVTQAYHGFHYLSLKICTDWLSVISSHFLNSWLMQGTVLWWVPKDLELWLCLWGTYYPSRQVELMLNSQLHHSHILWYGSSYIARLNLFPHRTIYSEKITWVSTQNMCSTICDIFWEISHPNCTMILQSWKSSGRTLNLSVKRHW